MDGYHIALYIHLLALVAAACASTLVHFADYRRGQSTTAGEALQWHRLIGVTSRTFPIVIVLLLATGSYMVTSAGSALWAAAWVKAGVTGAILLFVVGGYLGARGKRMARALAQIDPSATDFPRHDAIAHTLGGMNTGLALGVVGAMAMKPEMLGSFAILAVAALLGAGWSMRSGRAASPVAEFAE